MDFIFVDTITMYEALHGFIKTIHYINGEEIILSSIEPFEEYPFNDNKFIVTINNLGVMYDFEHNKRGKLIIHLIIT
jgi:hypothetical protein